MRSVFSICVSSVYILALCLGCQPSPKDLYNQGRVATNEGDFNQALQSFKLILDAPQISDDYRYKALFGESEIYKIQKKYDKRARLLQRIIEDKTLNEFSGALKKDLADLYVLQAEQAIGKSSSNAAVIALFRQAIDLDSRSKARLKLARKLRDEGDVEFKNRERLSKLSFGGHKKISRIERKTYFHQLKFS